MEACSVARIMSLGQLDLSILHKLLALSPGSHGKFRKDPPPPMVETLPELPLDVLMDIFALLEIPDLVRAGSVCSFWRSAYSSLHTQLEQYKRPQTPCLLYTSSESVDDNVACLYSLAEKRVYHLALPDPPIRTRHLIGSSHGWLVTVIDKSELHLLNPITGQQIALPSMITIEEVEPVLDNAGAVNKYKLWDFDLDTPTDVLDSFSDCFCIRAFVFPDRSTGSYIVVLIYNPDHNLSFARVGDYKWTSLPGSDYRHCIHMDDLLYAFTLTGGVYAFDLTVPAMTRNIITDGLKNCMSVGYIYSVQAPWGDLLQVNRKFGTTEEAFIKTEEILLHKIDLAEKKLVEMNGLHAHVLFLGRSQAQCLSTEEYPQLKPNRAYFTDDLTHVSMYKDEDRDIGIINLEDGSSEEIVSTLWCNWPNPIWMTPNLTRMNMALDK